MTTSTTKWHRRFLGLADHVSSWSKDPSTKVGAVIVRPDRTIVSIGYNGFPRGVLDTTDRYENREVKYQMVVHAEINAILTAKQSLKHCTLYVSPLNPCPQCAAAIIQSGIWRVVSRVNDREDWRERVETAWQMFRESNVTLDLIE